MTTPEHQHTDDDGTRLTVRFDDDTDNVYVDVDLSGATGGGASVWVTPDQAPAVARAVLAQRPDVAVVEGLPEVGRMWRDGDVISTQARSTSLGQSDATDDETLLDIVAINLAVLAHRQAERKAAAHALRLDDPAVVEVQRLMRNRIGSDVDEEAIAPDLVAAVRRIDATPDHPEPGAVLTAEDPEPPPGSVVRRSFGAYCGMEWERVDEGWVLADYPNYAASGWAELSRSAAATLVRWGPQA